MPEAVALSVFGAIAALAMLVLVVQGLTQMVGRSAPDIAVLRVLGATRGQAAPGWWTGSSRPTRTGLRAAATS